jgi:diguanylate cyclase (GGDEF)-like protein
LACSLAVTLAVGSYLFIVIQRSALNSAHSALRTRLHEFVDGTALPLDQPTLLQQRLNTIVLSNRDLSSLQLTQNGNVVAKIVTSEASLGAPLSAQIALPGQPDWQLLASSSGQEIQEQLGQTRSYALLGFIGAVLLSALFARLLTRNANRMMDGFVDTFKKVASGELDVRMNETGNAEFGRLALAFNQMSERLKRTLGERERMLQDISIAHDQLQTNIRERTAELTRINELLRHEHEQGARLEANLAEAAATDTMTMLLNRRAMMEVLGQIGAIKKKREKTCCLLTLDIDHFKQINDRFGHAKGDQVLIQVATQLRGAMSSDEVAARWGGEEFLLLWPDQSLAAAEQRANRLREKLASAIQVGADFKFTVSMGLAQWRDDEDLAQALLRSDRSLYAAKAAGRNRVCVLS